MWKVQRKDYIRNPGGKNQYEDDEKRSGGNSCHQTKNTDPRVFVWNALNSGIPIFWKPALTGLPEAIVKYI